MHNGKCFHLGAGVLRQCCPLGHGDAQWRQGSTSDTSHTQSGLKESSSGHRRSAGKPIPRPAQAFHSFILRFLSRFKGGHEVKGEPLTLRAALSLVVRLH